VRLRLGFLKIVSYKNPAFLNRTAKVVKREENRSKKPQKMRHR
jgi:hypothetical protein